MKECVEAGKNYGAKIMADLIEIKDEDLEKRAKEAEKLGVDYIGVHCSIDEQMRGKDAFGRLRRVAKVVNIPIACAGGINSETALKTLDINTEYIFQEVLLL